MKKASEYPANTARVLKEAASARKLMGKRPVRWLGALPPTEERNFCRNFSAMINNRTIDIYDDTRLLLTNRRFPSACVIARGMIETYAFGRSALSSVTKALEDEGAEAAQDSMIKIINSNFFKVKEQRALKEGKFRLQDYHFTQQATERMLSEEASIVRVGKALDRLFKDEIAQTGAKESRMELVYDGLCEWTHPSQNSLFHAYCEEAANIPTSLGDIHKWDAAQSICAFALHFLTAVPELCSDLDALGDRVSAKTPPVS